MHRDVGQVYQAVPSVRGQVTDAPVSPHVRVRVYASESNICAGNYWETCLAMAEITDFDMRGEMDERRENAEYVAVLREIQPTGTAEIADVFGVAQSKARRRLEKLRNGDAPVDRKKIGGVHVWFVDTDEQDADAANAAEIVRRRMGIDDGHGDGVKDGR